MTGTRERVTDTMSDADTLLWTMSRDPVLRPTIVAVMALDRAPRWEDVRTRMEAMTRLVPRLRSHVVQRPLGAGRPLFVEDAHFDLDVHIRRIVLPPPGTFRALLDMAQVMATTGFDPGLPLWEAVVVEGIEGERAAFVIKLHHALIDGVGGVAVLVHLLDPHRRPAGTRASTSPASPVTERKQIDGVPASRGGSPLLHLPDTRHLFEAALHAASHPAESLDQLRSTAESAARLLAPAGRPMSTLMTERGFGRRFEVLDLSLGELREAEAATGGTLNDVFVAGVVGGLQRYHDLHGANLDSLRMLMPVNMRGGAEPVSGNHFVPARFVVQAARDPGERVREVHRVAGEWKHAPALGLSDMLAAGLNLLPDPLVTALWGSMLKGDDCCITNVPGPPFETYLAGAQVERIYAFAPPSGAALNVALVTLAGRACVGINFDAAAVPDPAKLAACLDEGFGEVVRLGRTDKEETP